MDCITPPIRLQRNFTEYEMTRVFIGMVSLVTLTSESLSLRLSPDFEVRTNDFPEQVKITC